MSDDLPEPISEYLRAHPDLVVARLIEQGVLTDTLWRADGVGGPHTQGEGCNVNCEALYRVVLPDQNEAPT